MPRSRALARREEADATSLREGGGGGSVGRGGFAGSASVAVCPPPLAALAGAVAGSVVTAVLHPLDTLKVLVQAGGRVGGERHLSGVLLAGLRSRGVGFLYAGVWPALAASAPISAVYTFTYEAAKARLQRRLPERRIWVGQCAAGACASVATSFIYTPTECVKAQLQVLNHPPPASISRPRPLLGSVMVRRRYKALQRS